MKKFIFSVICCLLCSIIFFKNNNFLLKADTYYTDVLNPTEENIINDIVYEKLALFEYEYEIISSFSSLNRYVLVEGDDCYLIYDREFRDYIEFSLTTNSIYYSKQNVQKIYLAPTYYFMYENNKIIDLVSEEEITSNEVVKYKSIENEINSNFINNQNNSLFISKTDNVLRNSAPSGPVYISHRYYFDNLKDNMGSNTQNLYDGSCSYVAIGMVLSYYDSIINDDVIEENYDVNEIRNFSSYSLINLISYEESPGINDTFHEYIIELGRENGYTDSNDFSISLLDMDNFLDEYFSSRNMDITTHNTNIFNNKVNFCKEAIDSNNPVIIQITGTDTSLDFRDLNHAVVGYGYDESGIYVNFGWKGDNVNVNINNYSIPRAFYIELNEAHICSNNYKWQYNGCTGTVCSCGGKTCNHENKNVSHYGEIYHNFLCMSCGDNILEEHNFYISGDHKKCSDCEYEVEIEHVHSYNYSYAEYNGNQHKAYCICGEFVLQGHVVRSDEFGNTTKKCLLCNAEIKNGFVITSTNSNKIYLTNKGSYILSNGLIVLVDEDIDSYINGNLVFYKKKDNVDLN